MDRPGLGSPPQALRLDRTMPRICSAAGLVPLRAMLERNFRQSSPSPSADHTCSASAVARASVIRDAGQGPAATIRWEGEVKRRESVRPTEFTSKKKERRSRRRDSS